MASAAHHLQSRSGRCFASPAARALARQSGLVLDALDGSGPQGRVVRADVLAALESGEPATVRNPPVTEPAVLPEAAGPFQALPFTPLRRAMARRLSASKQQAPHFYVRVDCEVDAVLRLRAAMQPRAQAEGLHLTLNDFLLHAAARALRQVPALNAAVDDAGVRQFEQVHMAVAVAVDGGLLTPVLRDADRKSVAQISAEVRTLAAQARAGRLAAAASGGGTFSVSNLGAQGVTEFAAVINPPQAGILALGAAMPRPVVRDGQLGVATVLTATLSADHRAIDGAVAARYLAAFKALLARPSAEAVWQAAPGAGEGA
jgi:pyruvate dehydrogenase E2 component (dihydrolipoamide acetyltransferase)